MPNEDALERIATALEELVVAAGQQTAALYRIATSLELEEEVSIHTHVSAERLKQAQKARTILLRRSMAKDADWFGAPPSNDL